ncbi:hypothetical protein B9479_008270, partial [Cryptococcus floricola]
RPSVALFPNLEWLVIPSSMQGNVTLTDEGHAPSIHTRKEPHLQAYDALRDIDALQPHRLCVTESPHMSSVRAMCRAYFFAKDTHQLEELSVHGTTGQARSFMSQNRTRVLNVAFAIPAVTREAEAEAGERNEEGGEETQVHGPEVQLGWHLDMLHYSEQDLRTSSSFRIPSPASHPLLSGFSQGAKQYTSVKKGKQVNKYCGERGYGPGVSMARGSSVKLVGLSVRGLVMRCLRDQFTFSLFYPSTFDFARSPDLSARITMVKWGYGSGGSIGVDQGARPEGLGGVRSRPRCRPL